MAAQKGQVTLPSDLHQDYGKESIREGFGGGLTMQEAMDRMRVGPTRTREYEEFYRPEIQKLGALGEREALSAFQQEKARALANLGYARSAGTGGSGAYDAAAIAIERGSQQQLGSIKRSAEMYELGAYLKFMDREDQQSAQLQAMREGFDYQMRMAEENSASWWEGLGSIAGMALAIWQPWNRKTPVTNTPSPVQA